MKFKPHCTSGKRDSLAIRQPAWTSPETASISQVYGRLRSNLNYDFGHVGLDELDGGWVHGLTVFDSGGLSIYRNGLLQQSTTASVSGISINGTSTLGAGHVATNSEPFNFCHCALDDIGIWNRALTEEEILALYNAPLPLHQAAPTRPPATSMKRLT